MKKLNPPSRFSCLALIIFFFLISCSHSPVVDEKSEGEQTWQDAVKDRKPLTLFLSGVGVSSFASIGVIKALHRRNIKIEKIVASGWPAIFALVYAHKKSINELEWFAFKLKKHHFFKKSYFSKQHKTHTRFVKEMNKIIKSTIFEKLKIPVTILAKSLNSGQTYSFNSGSWEEALKATTSYPLMGKFHRWDKQRWTGVIDTNDLEEWSGGDNSFLFVDMHQDYLRYLRSHQHQEKGLERLSQKSAIKFYNKREVDNFSSRMPLIQRGYKETLRRLSTQTPY